MNMPGPSGLQLASEFLRIRPDIPVLLITGFVTAELKEQARLAGVKGVIFKPTTVEEFAQAITCATVAC
jgi:DNA-binding NarL/FixJ family response regulator